MGEKNARYDSMKTVKTGYQEGDCMGPIYHIRPGHQAQR